LEAFEHYAELLNGSVQRVCLSTPRGQAVDLAVLCIQDWTLTGSDHPTEAETAHDIALMLCAGDRNEAWRLYDCLASGGQITTPMRESKWAELAGGLIDRYGTAWIVCHGIQDGTARLSSRTAHMSLDVLPLDRDLAAGNHRTTRMLHQEAKDKEVPVFMHQEVRRTSTAEVVRRS
jgi:uncharacterized glyoxalase superfamily protein PhnB